MLLSSKSANNLKVELLIVIKDQARAPHERKAGVLDKSKPKRRLSVRRSPLLLRQLKPPLFRSLQQRQFSSVNFNRNDLLDLQTLWPVLLLSKSDKLPKVELLVVLLVE